jgi:hypothetical protein
VQPVVSSLFALVLLVAGCGETSPRFALQEDARSQFAPLPGTIGVRLQTQQQVWQLIIAPVFRTLSIGGKMISEVSDGEKSVCS